MSAYPVELYVGRGRSLAVLCAVHNCCFKLYDSASRAVVFCAPLGRLERVQRDRRSLLFRLCFGGRAPLICHSRHRGHVLRALQAALLGAHAGDSLNYTT